MKKNQYNYDHKNIERRINEYAARLNQQQQDHHHHHDLSKRSKKRILQAIGKLKRKRKEQEMGSKEKEEEEEEEEKLGEEEEEVRSKEVEEKDRKEKEEKEAKKGRNRWDREGEDVGSREGDEDEPKEKKRKDIKRRKIQNKNKCNDNNYEEDGYHSNPYGVDKLLISMDLDMINPMNGKETMNNIGIEKLSSKQKKTKMRIINQELAEYARTKQLKIAEKRFRYALRNGLTPDVHTYTKCLGHLTPPAPRVHPRCRGVAGRAGRAA